MTSLAPYRAWPRTERVDGSRITFGKSGRQALRSRTTGSIRLRYVAMIAISHKYILTGNAGRSCFASLAARRAIRSLSLYIGEPFALIVVFMHPFLCHRRPGRRERRPACCTAGCSGFSATGRCPSRSPHSDPSERSALSV